jgi:NADH-quinone oxidoreductase subunit J
METFLVGLFSAVSIGSAVGMILQRYMVYSIGLMIMVLLGVAGLFLTLNAPFLALVQVIVYAGAVMVLFLFSSMIVGEKESPDLEVGNAYSWLVLGILALFFLDFWMIIANTPMPTGLPGSFSIDLQGGHPITYLGTVLFTEYALALQSVGLVLLVALVGAVYISGEGTT